MTLSLTPILRLHPDEQFLPCSVPWYLQHSCLHNADGLLASPVSEADLLKHNHSGAYLRLAKPEEARKGSGLSEAPPIYVRESSPHLWHYLFFYAFNGPSYLGYFGNHEADLERVSVVVDAQGHPKKLFYSAHSGGKWLDPSQVEWQDGHPVVYVALGSHACYSSAGTHCRLAGLANDHCSDQGATWSPVAETLKEQQWLHFRGRWGPDSIFGPAMRSWWS